MVERTFADEISVMIQDAIRQIPVPQKGVIKQVYPDEQHVDIEVKTQILKYVETMGTPVVNAPGVLLFLNGNIDDYIFLTPSSGDWSSIEEDMLR